MTNEEKKIDKITDGVEDLLNSKPVKILVYVGCGVGILLIGSFVIKALTFTVSNFKKLERACKEPVNALPPLTKLP